VAANQLRLYRTAPFTKSYVGKVFPPPFSVPTCRSWPCSSTSCAVVASRWRGCCVSCRSAGLAARTSLKCAGWQGRNGTLARRVVI